MRRVTYFDRINNVELASDTFVYYPFTSNVIILGGEWQVPADPVQFPGEHGLFDLGIELYRDEGYYVRMFDEDDADSWDGEGAAYDAIVEAINDYGVGNVSLVGYSHGASSAWGVAWRLNSNATGNLTDITKPFTISFTSYIDGVDDYGSNPEIRRPPLSAFHTNQYQTNDLPPLPRGARGSGNDEVDRSAIPGIEHKLMDDDPQVLGLVRARALQKVVP
jgi:hypothetical protein